MFNQYDLLKEIGTAAKLKADSLGKVKKLKREPESDEQKEQFMLSAFYFKVILRI